MKNLKDILETYADHKPDLNSDQQEAANKLFDLYCEIAKNFTVDEMVEIDDWVGSKTEYDKILSNCKK